MKIAVTGARGLIGSSLVPHLRSEGHQVMRIVRAGGGADDISWDPHAGAIEVERLGDLDAVVHLAGAGVGDHRWNSDYKKVILSSRVEGTTVLAKALSELSRPP